MLERLLEGFDRRVQQAPHDRWSSPTPCEGWSAADLVSHVATNMTGLAAALTGEAPTAFDPDDVKGSWAKALESILHALRTADLTTKVPGPIGLMPAHAVIDNLLTVDVLVHTWDLARAVGGDETLDSDDVARAYAVMQPMDAVIRAPGVFGPRLPVPEGADAQTELLHFLGRAT
jgi:uncharacterized protein (TIGR03086 family)